MNWNGLDDFLGMRGYGLYVWGSYGLAVAIAVVEPWMTRRRRLKAQRDVVNAMGDES